MEMKIPFNILLEIEEVTAQRRRLVLIFSVACWKGEMTSCLNA
jgi:hypothetical protein